MFRSTIAVLGFFVVAGLAAAEDKVAKPLGTWVHATDNHKVTLVFKADKLTLTNHYDGSFGGDLVFEASYEVTKDGKLKAKVTKLVKNTTLLGIEEGRPPKGLMFSFKYKIADGTMALSDSKGKEGDAWVSAKNIFDEGEYKKQKEEKKEDKKNK
jgi:hypothetical protein